MLAFGLIACCFLLGNSEGQLDGSWKDILESDYDKLAQDFNKLIEEKHDKTLKLQADSLKSFSENIGCLKLLNRKLEVVTKTFDVFESCLKVYDDEIGRPGQGFSKQDCMDQLVKQLSSPYDDKLDERDISRDDFLKFSQCIQDISKDLAKIPKDENVCFSELSVQTSISNIFHDIALTKLKVNAFLKIFFAYEEKFNNRAADQNYLVQRFEKNFNDIEKSWKETVQNLSREIWGCVSEEEKDPTVTLRGFQRFLLYDRDLENIGPLGSEVKSIKNQCTQNCTDLKIGRCSGFVTDCFEIPKPNQSFLQKLFRAKPKVEVCVSNSTNKLYDYIKYSRVKLGISNSECLSKETLSLDFVKNDAWISWFGDDSFLNMCTCMGTNETNSKIDLSEVTSDSDDNKIITGMRFVFENNTLRIQIEQGKLIDYGKIDQPSTQWKNITYKSDSDTEKNYYNVTYMNDVIFLNDLEAPKNSVLTGLRFETVNFGLRTALALAIRATPFNYQTGQIDSKNSQWIHNRSTNRTEVKLRRSHEIKFAENLENRDEITNNFIKLQTSNVFEDVGQFMMPKINVKEVFPKLRVPLSGVGLDYKVRQESGGFIGPKLLTYDQSRHALSDSARLPTNLEKYLNYFQRKI